jgi:hypothetical protein
MKRIYKLSSSTVGILATGRFLLLIYPDKLKIDFDKKELFLYKEGIRLSLKCIVNVELSYRKYASDIFLETKSGNFLIRSINIHKAQKIKSLLESYLWSISGAI